METITYKGKEYKARYISNGALISVIDLNLVLLPDLESNDFNTWEYAGRIDNSICGFVSAEEIELPLKQLEKVCRDNGIIN